MEDTVRMRMELSVLEADCEDDNYLCAAFFDRAFYRRAVAQAWAIFFSGSLVLIGLFGLSGITPVQETGNLVNAGIRL